MPTATAHKLLQAIKEATADGTLDELAESLHPDQINQLCDAVAAEALPDLRTMRARPQTVRSRAKMWLSLLGDKDTLLPPFWSAEEVLSLPAGNEAQRKLVAMVMSQAVLMAKVMLASPPPNLATSQFGQGAIAEIADWLDKFLPS